MVHALDEVGRCSDGELVRRLEQLVRADRALSAKLLVHLGEVDARELFRDRSFSSMFDYCRSGLGMSEGEAGLRILTARVCRKFPLIVERLGAGALHLTAIRLLAPHLTAENHVQLLDRVRGMSKRKIEVLVAELAPKPDVPARMRKLPEARGRHRSGTLLCSTPLASVDADIAATSSTASNAATASAASCNAALTPFDANIAASDAAACNAVHLSADNAATASAASCSAALTTFAATIAAPCSVARIPAASVFSMQPSDAVMAFSAAQPTAARVAPEVVKGAFALQSPRRRATLKPLSPGRFELRLTVGQETHDALRQLVELLRHQNPSGDMTCIVERALCELLKREMKRRFGQTDAKQPRAASKHAPDAIPLETRAEIEPESTAMPSETRENSELAPDAMPGEMRENSKYASVGLSGEARGNSEHASTVKSVETRGNSEHVAAAEPLERKLVWQKVEAKSEEACSTKSRHIPSAVRREVHTRDNGQCTFVASDGRRCSERGFLEIHHHNTTFARGGAATTDNLRLACRAHNRFYAEQDYGRAFMQAKVREAAARKQLSLVPAGEL